MAERALLVDDAPTSPPRPAPSGAEPTGFAAPDAWRERLEVDRKHVWHPYAPIPAADPALPVVGARGTRIELADGTELVDGMSSWWSAIHGYRNEAIDAALRAQLDRLPHVMFGGLTHEPAIELCERLLSIAPPQLRHVFLADSGSVAVEVALKMAIQAAYARRGPGPWRVLSLRGAYHGDTAGAMSVGDADDGMHAMFARWLPPQLRLPRPPAGYGEPIEAEWARAAERAFEEHGGGIAAVIVEPVVQGAGGMHIYSPEHLRLLRELCDRHGASLIFDEVATGLGRTGRMLAADHARVVPDVLCLGKALTGGYMTLAATICTTEVAEAVSEAGSLMHGPTFMGNPLACAAANASLGLLESGRWRDDVARIERGLAAGLGEARSLDGVEDVRVLGAIGVIELRRPVEMRSATAVALAHGAWLRPFGRLVYAMPAYVSSDEDIETISAAMTAIAREARTQDKES